MVERLANEILDAKQWSGCRGRGREDVHKMARPTGHSRTTAGDHSAASRWCGGRARTRAFNIEFFKLKEWRQLWHRTC